MGSLFFLGHQEVDPRSSSSGEAWRPDHQASGDLGRSWALAWGPTKEKEEFSRASSEMLH